MVPLLSSWLYVAVFLLALADALWHPPGVRVAAVAVLAVFLVVELPRMARTPLIVGTVLTTAGVAIGLFAGQGGAVVFDGLARTLPFLLLFGAVAWLQVAAAESPTLKATRDTVMSQPPGWRYIILAVAAHGLGAVFNLAGMSLLATMLGQQKDKLLRMRLARAMVHGFGTAAAWSPLFVGAAVILSVVPGVRWIEIAPFGMTIAAIYIAISWTMDRLTNPAGPVSLKANAPVPFPAWAGRRLAVLVGVLFVLVIGMVEWRRLSIPVAIGTIAPFYAFIWNASRAGLARGGQMAARIVRNLSSLRGEAILFSGANVFGTGISAAVGPEDARRAIEGLHITPDVGLMALAIGTTAFGALGLHPVVIAVLVGHVLPPAVLGVEPPVLAFLLMSLWGLGTNVSPISATSLFMARVTGESIWHISWVWNAPFCFIGAVTAGAAAILLRHSGVFGTLP